MSRKDVNYTRDILPDPKFGNIVIAKTVNCIMKSGKKSTAETALYRALEVVAQKTKSDSLDVFFKAIDNVRPLVEVRSRRVGGANYQVPTEVRAERGQSLAIRWLVGTANDRAERRIEERLAGEIMDAASNRGLAVKKREDTHKMAEANKAFAHFKW